MLSVVYCDQIIQDPFAQDYKSLMYKNLVIVSIWLMLSVSLSLKVFCLLLSKYFNNYFCLTIEKQNSFANFFSNMLHIMPLMIQISVFFSKLN